MFDDSNVSDTTTDSTTSSDTGSSGASGNDTASEGSSSSDTDGGGKKRTHTSPRVIMGAEVEACIASLRSKWEGNDDVVGVLNTLSESVRTLATGGHPKVEGSGKVGRPAQPKNPLTGKSHYVGQTQGGTFCYINTEGKIPTPASLVQCVKVWGPFRTPEGAKYTIAHPETLAHRDVVFDTTKDA